MILSCLSRGRAVMICAALSITCAKAAADDLISIYVKALDGNPAYRSVVAAYDQTAEKEPQALAKLLPQIGISGEYDNINQSVSGRFFVGSFTNDGRGFDTNRDDGSNSYSYLIGLQQVLFHKDLLIELDQAELEVSRAGLLTYDAQNQLRVSVAEAYFAALQADDVLRFATAEKEAIAQVLEQTRSKTASGISTDVALKNAQAQYDLADAALVEAKNAVEISRVQLELITGGQKPGPLKPLAPGFVAQAPEPNSINEWTDRARTQNLKLQAQQIETQIARKQLDRAYAQRLPQVDAFAARSYEYADGGISKGIGADNNHFVDMRVGVRVKVPIFTGGAISSGIRACLAGVTRAEADEAAKRKDAVHDVQVAFLKSTAGMAKLTALRQAVESTKAAEDAARVGYEVGTRTNADLLLAVRSRYKAETDYATARYEYLLENLRLRAAAGSLNHSDLLAINRLLN